MKLMNCGNDFTEECFIELCNQLEKGEHIEVYIDCIGHGRNNLYQDFYKEKLIKRYGEKLIVDFKDGFSRMYNYQLK